MKIVIEYDVEADGTISAVPSRGSLVENGETIQELSLLVLPAYSFGGIQDKAMRVPLQLPASH